MYIQLDGQLSGTGLFHLDGMPIDIRTLSLTQQTREELAAWLERYRLSKYNGFKEYRRQLRKGAVIDLDKEGLRLRAIIQNELQKTNPEVFVTYWSEAVGAHLNDDGVAISDWKGMVGKMMILGLLFLLLFSCSDRVAHVGNTAEYRIIRIQKKLLEDGYKTQTYILGKGSEEDNLRKLAEDLGVTDNVHFSGYQSNPHKFVSKCDLFVCTSFSEGFSTAATEALIVGTPVCTVDVSGMKEMLGEYNEYGVVTENNEEALYEGIKMLLDNPDLLAHYKKQAGIRGSMFSTATTVKEVENMLIQLSGGC